MAIIIVTNLIQQGHIIEATRRLVAADVSMKQCGLTIDYHKAKYYVAGRLQHKSSCIFLNYWVII